MGPAFWLFIGPNLTFGILSFFLFRKGLLLFQVFANREEAHGNPEVFDVPLRDAEIEGDVAFFTTHEEVIWCELNLCGICSD